MTRRLIGSILENAADLVPTRLAVTCGEEAVTFGALEARCNRLAHVLRHLGIGRGDRVLVWFSTSIEAIEVFFTLQKLGVAYVPLNPNFSIAEAGEMAAYVRPALFLSDTAHASAAEAAASTVPGLRLAVRGGAGAPVPRTDLDRAMAVAAESRPEAEVEEEDVQAIFLTSGSTGKPKGVMLSHRASWIRAAYASGSPSAASGGAGEVCMFPLFHFAGCLFVSVAMAALRAIHLTADTSAPALLSLVERHRPAWLYCIPAVWERILACRETFDTSSLRYANLGTSRVEPDLIQRLRDRFPHTSNAVMYGSTEFGSALALAHEDIARKPYSVGLPRPGAAARVIEGELCLAGETLMSGYFDRPESTAQVLRNGWYHSGDIVEQDDEGYFTITGRVKEMIRTGGEWVAPVEVEAALSGWPGFREIAVVGLPDPRWGELVCAAVVLEEGAILPELAALREHLSARLAAYKHPRRLVAVANLPRTPATGQIQRARIAAAITAPC